MRATATALATAPVLCRHCGDPCDGPPVISDHGTFCCQGCRTVFDVLQVHELTEFYSCDFAPGVSQKGAEHRDLARFAALDDPAVAARLLEFDDGRLAKATLSVPTIHCASCVWLLEQLWRVDPGIQRSEVDLLRRTLRIEFRPQETTLRAVAETLAVLGYEPSLSRETATETVPPARKRLHLQLGVAGFAFGNIMLFSIPRYVNGAPLDGGFQRLFDALNLAFAVPVLLFSAADFFRGCWHAIRARQMTLDVPLALGLAVLFVRSAAEILSGRGEGFMDSFAGLTFFLLIGRLFQQKAFDAIAFDRTFRSFFPLSVRVERESGWQMVPLEQLRAGDVIHVRPNEVVPADALMMDVSGHVDYAFITGEQTPVAVQRGATIRAGGRAYGAGLRLVVTREVSHSQLASLWNNPIFGKPKERWLTDVAARFGLWFTVAAVGLAVAGAVVWWPDAGMSARVATAVLIIACPCALTLSAPITLGTAMGLLGRSGLYLKHAAVALDLSRITTIAFDKTGTLTTSGGPVVVEQGGLNEAERRLVRRLAAESVHPTSRAIAQHGASHGKVERIVEVPGQGISGWVDSRFVAIGTSSFVATVTGAIPPAHDGLTCVAVGTGTSDSVVHVGWVRVATPVRTGIDRVTRTLTRTHDVCLVSGDHGMDAPRWRRLFGERMRFRQSPEDKLSLVREEQAAGRRVLMVGDGLNDAGALAAADVGVAVSDDTACMVPACDAVLHGERLEHLPLFLQYARRARQVVLLCFAVSIFYNAIGLSLALAGALTPLVTAILMPVSSLTIVGISTGAMRWFARRMLPA